MQVRLLVEINMFSVFPYYGLAEEKTIFFDIKCHNSYKRSAYTIILPKMIQYGDTFTYHILFLTLKLHLTNVTLNM